MTGETRFQMQRRGWVASIIAATAGLAPAIFFESLFVKISVKKNATASNAKAHDGFSYSRDHFEELVDTALAHAKKLGATNAGAEASEGCGLSVSVRKGELENVERNRDKSLGVTV
jgi:PmbA protein